MHSVVFSFRCTAGWFGCAYICIFSPKFVSHLGYCKILSRVSCAIQYFLSILLATQSCLTFCDPMDYSPPGFSVHGILQARILQWVAIPFSKGSSWPRDQTQVSGIAGRFFTICATRDEKLVTKTVLMQIHRESKLILLWSIETSRLRNLAQKPV